MNEWPTLTISVNRWENWDPEGGRDLSIVKFENPEWAPTTIWLSPPLFDLRKDQYGSWKLTPFDNAVDYGSDAFPFIYLTWLSDNLSGFFPPHKQFLHHTQYFPLLPSLFSPAPPAHPFKPHSQVHCEPSHTPPGWVLLASLPHLHGFSSYFHMGTYHSAL